MGLVGGAWDRWRCRQRQPWCACTFCGREGRACGYVLRTGRAASPARLCWAPPSPLPPFSPVRSVLTLTIHRCRARVGGPRSNGGGGSGEEEEGTRRRAREGGRAAGAIQSYTAVRRREEWGEISRVCHMPLGTHRVRFLRVWRCGRGRVCGGCVSRSTKEGRKEEQEGEDRARAHRAARTRTDSESGSKCGWRRRVNEGEEAKTMTAIS